MSYRDPTKAELQSPEFEAIWQTIKTWDINVPSAYKGYCGATGNHVAAILDALRDFRLVWLLDRSPTVNDESGWESVGKSKDLDENTLAEGIKSDSHDLP